MKKKIMLLIVLMTAALPLWAGDDVRDYPLRLQIVTTSQVRRVNGMVSVSGKATLVDPSTNTSSALAYSGSCLFGFQSAPTAAMLMSPAKWKKEGSKLSVLWHRLGTENKTEKCDLDVYDILSHKAYVAGGGRLQLVTEDQLKLQEHATEVLQRDQQFLDADPAHYPLRVLILAANWEEQPYGFSGRGRGNVYAGDQANGIDFNAICPTRLAGGIGNYYPAQWAAESSRLLLLVHPIGEERKAKHCELSTDTKSFVYYRNPDTGIISNLSQDEYKSRHENQQMGQSQSHLAQTVATQSQPAVAIPGVQKLSVNSVPDSADIEVDGAFVGSTPSVIELKTGEHTIVVHKSGYKPWERKLKLESGDIKVNAELERNVSAKE
jgi:hypothetical protein